MSDRPAPEDVKRGVKISNAVRSFMVRNWLDGSAARSDRITRKMLEEEGYRIVRVDDLRTACPHCGGSGRLYDTDDRGEPCGVCREDGYIIFGEGS